MLDAQKISALQHQATERWHQAAVAETPEGSPLERLVLEQHRANFDLWHREDEARDPESTDAGIAAVKRSIDHLNQRRNDLVERIDELLLAAVQQNQAAELHSETAGMMVDRLSILSLKIFHTREETVRPGALEAHRQRNRDRLLVLDEQHRDLADCLGRLWNAVGAGERRFRLYRQLKMYNDPTLNPVLYGVSSGSGKRP